MLTKKRYSVKEMISWTRGESLVYMLFMIVITIFYDYFKFTFLRVPWTPVALIGTAVAFIIGFQNSAAYGRIWEARKIWGGIVNSSRTWAMKVTAMVSNEHSKSPVTEKELTEIKKVLIYRHIAWLTALRHAMRQPKNWEVFKDHKTNREWTKKVHIPERVFSLEDDLFHYLSAEDWEYAMDKGNKSTVLLFLQSKSITDLKEKGLLWEFSFLELENLLEELFTLQGKSERIKNFPYPRQYATLSYQFVRVFMILLPFGLLPAFGDIGLKISETYPIIGKYFVWLGIPFTTAVAWVFHTMERIGRVGENPFEGSANDVPISTIARGIEIDIRQMMDEDDDIIPKQFPEEFNVQM